MGCNQSAKFDVQLQIELNTPYFTKTSILQKFQLRLTIRELCKSIISLNLNSEYQPQNLCFRIIYKGKTFSIKDSTTLLELHVTPFDIISIQGELKVSALIAITLKYCGENVKEEVKEIASDTLVTSILHNPSAKAVFGYLQLDNDQRLSDYEIMPRTKLHIVEDFRLPEEIQAWKIKKTGLIFEALCMNEGCEAYKQRICINLGVGEFDINAELSGDNERKCECCDSLLGKVCKVGFAHCIVRYEVVLADGTCREIRDVVKNYIENNSKNWPSVVKVDKFN